MKHMAVALLAVFIAVPVAAQVPAGAEFRVNGFTTGNQWMSSAAADPTGGFVLVWTSENQDGSGLGVFARRFDAAGAPRGPEFRVNSTTAGNQSSGQVAVDGAGAFAVTWTSQDGSGSGVFAQRYDRTGAAQGAEFQVNAYTTGNQAGPVIAFDSARNLVVAWTGPGEGDASGLFARRFDASGAPRGAEFAVSGDSTVPFAPALATDGAGRLIVAWIGNGLWVRSYDASGGSFVKQVDPGGLTIVVSSTLGLAADLAGNFVVTWSSIDYMPPVRDPFAPEARGTFASRFDAAGGVRGTTTVDSLIHSWTPAAGDASGAFVVAWDGSPGMVAGRRYDGAGILRGSGFPFNGSPATSEPTKDIASDAVGNLLAAWTNNGLDGQGNGVFAQRFGGLVPASAAVDTAVSGGSNGNGVLEPGETADVRPAWRNVNGAAQSFNGAGLGFTGPPATGATYQLLDASALYGAVADGATAGCTDCYSVAVSFPGPRPAIHVDATFTERLTPDTLGQTKPWATHVGRSFSDVPSTSPYYRDVETLLHRGVTAGCATGYCPAGVTTREQMAAFLLAAREGAGYLARACSAPSMFADVPPTSPFCNVIEELARRGVTGGCGGGNYCPSAGVSRDQMAVFLLRTLDPALVPPACGTPRFADVPASSPFCPWIEELARRGITAGCGGGSYCPAAGVTREQMATLIAGTFSLTLYGP